MLGRLSDTIGKYPTFCVGSGLSLVLVVYYCSLGVTPFGIVIA